MSDRDTGYCPECDFVRRADVADFVCPVCSREMTPLDEHLDAMRVARRDLEERLRAADAEVEALKETRRYLQRVAEQKDQRVANLERLVAALRIAVLAVLTSEHEVPR